MGKKLVITEGATVLHQTSQKKPYKQAEKEMTFTVVKDKKLPARIL